METPFGEFIFFLGSLAFLCIAACILVLLFKAFTNWRERCWERDNKIEQILHYSKNISDKLSTTYYLVEKLDINVEKLCKKLDCFIDDGK